MQLALGTAQFGLAYGIGGRGEPVPEREVRAILEEAAHRGVRMLDTAAAYGEIETSLARLCAGLPLRLISKVSAIPAELTPSEAAEVALARARRSHQRLGSQLHGLLLHNSKDLMGERGEAIGSTLQTWAHAEGISLGASCYTTDEARNLVERTGIALMQLPGNALDQRVAQAIMRGELPGCEIHVRSVFLQGLLLMPLGLILERLPHAHSTILRWRAWVEQQGFGLLDASLAIVKSFKGVSTIVVGVDSYKHWLEIADAWDRTVATAAPELSITDTSIIDIRRW
jgi:aryl-alcohol dehydrogenase-like predicted oxidoreductase